MLTEEMKDFLILLFDDELIIINLKDLITLGDMDEVIQRHGYSFTAKDFMDAVDVLIKAGSIK